MTARKKAELPELTPDYTEAMRQADWVAAETAGHNVPTETDFPEKPEQMP